MASRRVLGLLLLCIIRLLPMVGNEQGEASGVSMQQHVELPNTEMTDVLEKVEERTLEEMQSILEETERILEESDFSWGALLFAPMEQWQFWVVAAGLALLIALCLGVWRRTHVADSGDERERSVSITEEEDKGKRKDDFHAEERLLREKIRRSAQSLACRRREVEMVVSDVLGVLQERLSQSFFLVPQAAIGVGSAFEGWSPRGHDAVFRLLVPLKPSRGHAFQLELGTAGDTPAKHRVRVDLACTCAKEACVEDTMLCFVHQPYEALERNQDSGLLCQLCTGRYLDVQKIARWFQELVSSAWEEMGLGRRYQLRVLPSRRSCKLELTSASERSFLVEMLFGVQRGESDIFLSSQAPEAIFTPGIMWTESSAVAEAKFFSHVARQALPDSVHLQCLQLLTGSLVSTVLSSYTFKTAVMHLLNLCPGTSVPFTLQLQDVMCYLRSCLEEKCLHHFIFGNECLPKAIILPPATQPSEPVNIFQCLVEDPEAHAKALREFQELQGRLTGLLLFGA
ncbi:PREDICTED: inositol 1,4,5-trisphosphate receptor-interacting protein-like 1 [Calidris pugnax]|uniref:inositol 1,4,5-trisphosphate receptor-interacting protein-like 1 n=1 Tax=Calidris pugnax TaxID=198806 RepID=UPI00071E0130|nr:PREDICTED: inositol 1,4,5-trisphosphate receptor-interacting protein-like 1 [Calidris pugnax]